MLYISILSVERKAALRNVNKPAFILRLFALRGSKYLNNRIHVRAYLEALKPFSIFNPPRNELFCEHKPNVNARFTLITWSARLYYRYSLKTVPRCFPFMCHGSALSTVKCFDIALSALRKSGFELGCKRKITLGCASLLDDSYFDTLLWLWSS